MRTATAETGTPAPRAPRTMVAVCAALDAVALRIDEAGITPHQVTQFRSAPSFREVTVHLRSGEVDAFHALLAFYPTAERRDYTHNGETWLRALAATADGAVEIVLAEHAAVTS